jgi:hypothetical protein
LFLGEAKEERRTPPKLFFNCMGVCAPLLMADGHSIKHQAKVSVSTKKVNHALGTDKKWPEIAKFSC